MGEGVGAKRKGSLKDYKNKYEAILRLNGWGDQGGRGMTKNSCKGWEAEVKVLFENLARQQVHSMTHG